MPDSRRILIATFGSLGDLHPYLAVALALRARGHHPIIATHASHAAKVRAEGIEFRPVRPDPADFQPDEAMMRRVWKPVQGAVFLLRELVLANLRDSFEDLEAAAAGGVDLIVSHPLTYGAPLVAHRCGVPWVSTVLAPGSFGSAYDPPALPFAPGLLAALRGVPWAGPALVRAVLRGLQRSVRSWAEPVHALRRSLGLPPARVDPLVEGQFSPHGTLAMFSRALARPQPDWPARVRVTGFAFYDRPAEADGPGGRHDAAAAGALQAFLDAGPAPLAFTLGSAAVYHAGDFYERSVQVAQRLGRRAVLLVGGADARNRVPQPLPEGVAAFEYAPHSVLFPRAAAIVHQGGIGTCAQAMRAGRPSLVVPFGFDQPDNARRLVRLGIARTLTRERYRAGRVARELDALLRQARYAQRAAAVSRALGGEDGAREAAGALLGLLDGQSVAGSG